MSEKLPQPQPGASPELEPTTSSPAPRQESGYINLEENPKEKDSLSRKATTYTLKKLEEDTGRPWEELNAPTEKEGDEKIKEKIRGALKEMAVHGVIKRDREGDAVFEDGKVVISASTDLDGKVVIGLLKDKKHGGAGIEIKKEDIEYINPGTFSPGKVTFDSGNVAGVKVFETDKGEISMIVDHHGGESGRDSSASKLTYEILVQTDLIERTKALDRLIEFVTQLDNKTYPDEGRISYPERYKTILGLAANMSFGQLYNFFKSDLQPTEVLWEEEIEKHHLDKPIAKEKRKTEKSLERLGELEKEGFIVDSQRYGKIAIDIGGTVPHGIDAAEYCGYSTYINWNPRTNGFFMTSPSKGITDTFSQGFNVRGTMYMKPLSDRSPLTLKLGEVLDKMTDGQLNPTGELKIFLDQESRIDYNKKQETKMEKLPVSSEQPRSPLLLDTLTRLIKEIESKFNAGEVTEEQYLENIRPIERAQELEKTDPLKAARDLFAAELIGEDEFKNIKKELSSAIEQTEAAPVQENQESRDDQEVEGKIRDIIQSLSKEWEEKFNNSEITEMRHRQIQERLHEALMDLRLNPEEALYRLYAYQFISDDQLKELKSQLKPGDIETPTTPISPEPAPRALERDAPSLRERILEIKNRLEEIRTRLRSEVLRFSVLQDLRAERTRLEEELANLREQVQQETAPAPRPNQPQPTERSTSSPEQVKTPEAPASRTSAPVETPASREPSRAARPEYGFSDQEKIDNLKAELNSIDSQITKMSTLARNLNRPLEKALIEKDIERLKREKATKEKELNKLESPAEKGVGSVFKNFVRTAYEKVKDTYDNFFGTEVIKLNLRDEPQIDSNESRSTETSTAQTNRDPLPPQRPRDGGSERPGGFDPGDITLNRDTLPTAPEKKRRDWTLWSWFKERIRSFGPGEIVQAERLRRGTKFVGQELEAYAEMIEQEVDKDGDILQARVIENNRTIERIVVYAKEMMLERLAKARGQATSETVLSPANVRAFEQELRLQLKELRERTADSDKESLIQLLRRNLDRDWWYRYFYAATEATVLTWIGWKFLGSAPATPDQLPPIDLLGQDINLPIEQQRWMDTHIWDTSTDILHEQGVSNPTHQQIQDVASKIAQENSVRVIDPTTGDTLWEETSRGVNNDRLMKAGVIKVASGVLQAMRIAAGM